MFLKNGKSCVNLISTNYKMADNDENSEETRNVSENPTSTLYLDVEDTKWPIIYRHEYNISFCGLEKLHPFDSAKWGKIFEFLKQAKLLHDNTIISPNEASQEDLLVVHTKRYLNSLKWSVNVAAITEVPPVACLPNFIVQRRVLRPFRFHTGGTILGGKIAIERGWAINIGGGFHHCSSKRGGGFCAYADITLTLQFLFQKIEGISRALIVDLDAHQGNGYERDFMDDERVYIMDMYNRSIYPHDGYAKRSIKRKIELQSWTEDTEYLSLLNTNINGALNEFTPDIVIYNAGTDVLDGDPLGCLCITSKGIIDRDQMVFEAVRSRRIPILMVTSGGYMRSTARIIADSILNLHKHGFISSEAAESHTQTLYRTSREMDFTEGPSTTKTSNTNETQSDRNFFSKLLRK